MAYIDFVLERINEKETGKPIYSAEIARELAGQYGLATDKAGAAVAVTMKRIMDKGLQPKLRAYQKGIYYMTDITPFGEIGINTEQLIADKYLLHDQGYEGDLTFLYRIGLTTQIPRERELVTNQVKNCVRYDKRLGVTIRPPKIPITAENKWYLQLLDALEKMDRAPIDDEQPYQTIAAHIQKRGLQYGMLLALADRYYSKCVLSHLAHAASAGMLHETTPIYWERGLPAYLKESVERMKKTWELRDSGARCPRWDCDYCELQSNINTAEVEGLISKDQAWYLRETYLRIARN